MENRNAMPATEQENAANATEPGGPINHKIYLYNRKDILAMSYSATVYTVFIASPRDAQNERAIVKRVLQRWNAINSEATKSVLLPVTWEDNSAPETGMFAQDYINEELLDKCDILIGVFWTRVGTPTKHFEGGSIEEVYRQIGSRKQAMLYFSKKPIPADADFDQAQEVRKLKEKVEGSPIMFGEYYDDANFESILYDHIQIKMKEGKFRSTWDSDIISTIKDEKELIKAINGYFPLVAKNVLINIVDDKHDDDVWKAIVNKLQKSPADLRDALIFLAKRGAFKHPAYKYGVEKLVEINQQDLYSFMNTLYSINRYEFWDIYVSYNLEQSEVIQRLIIKIKEIEQDDV